MKARTPSQKTRASATAHFRLARKASIAGDQRLSSHHMDKALALRARADSQLAHEKRREEERNAHPPMKLKGTADEPLHRLR